MKKHLELGTLASGQPFALPLDLVTRTLAIIGIRGAGKTVTATVLAEEMCEAGLPFIALDPVGVWWGLRCNPDGTPGGYPVVVIGGQHGDLPLDAKGGRRWAEAILQENISCVIDLKLESKNDWRRFVADFCDRLMELNPAVARHVFLEEAPEFVPQKPLGEQRRSLAAVDRLTRLGRNQGYGATLVSQRYATIQKDVLCMCESLFAMRCVGKTDRDACEDWIAEVVHDTESAKKADTFMRSLTGLDDGTGWFWSPQWLNEFCQVRVRRRKTYHPGETRKFGQAPRQVQLSDVKDFVERFGRLVKPKAETVSVPRRVLTPAVEDAFVPDPRDTQITMLREQVQKLSTQLRESQEVTAALRKHLEPQYRTLQALFGELQRTNGALTVGDASVWEPWKAKLGAGPAKLIDILLERGACTRTQLQTLSGYASRSMTNHISKLNVNRLIERDGDKFQLRIP